MLPSKGAVEVTPAVADGIVLFDSTDGFFYALDRQKGELLWRYQTRGKVTTPADETVFVAAGHSVYALR